MKHYIIIKYNDTVQEREGLNQKIAELFYRARDLKGVFSVSVSPAVVLSKQRYDLMICMEMEKESLELFDRSELHSQWKEYFSQYIAHKVIFDCD